MVDKQTAALRTANDELIDENLIRRETEDKLRLANTTKDKFFSIIAHDLKSPFNALLGFTDLLLTEWDDFEDAQKKDIILNIGQSSKNTYNLLNNLLDWARIQKGTMKPKIRQFAVQELFPQIRNVVQASAEIKNINLEMIADDSAQVLADEFMLLTVFRNLISNAIKFTPQGGEIILSVTKYEKHILCKVKDSGIGMNENTLKKLFSVENAGTTSGTNGEKGTGLGLIITREFIHLMHGKIWVESAVGEGSVFYVQLPMAEEAQRL
jgi:signal transduction histidine kinase